MKIYFKPCVEKFRERERERERGVTPKDKLLEKQAIETKQHKAKQSKKKTTTKNKSKHTTKLLRKVLKGIENLHVKMEALF